MAYYNSYWVLLNLLFWSAWDIQFVSANQGCPDIEEICRDWNRDSNLEDIFEEFGDQCPESMYLHLLDPDICVHYPDLDKPSEVEVTFHTQPVNQTKEIGQSVEFRCVTSPVAHKTYWYFNDVFINKDDPQVIGKVTVDDKLLVIHGEAGPEFYGKYRCEVVLNRGIVHRSAWLTGPESEGPLCTLVLIKLATNVNVDKTHIKRHELHILKCGAKYGVGGVSKTWFKKTGDSKIDVTKSRQRHNPLVLPSGHLLITSARRVHRGEYICEIKDKAGCVKSTSVNVEVYTHPSEICGTAVKDPNHSNTSVGRVVDKIKMGEKAFEGSAPWQVSLQNLRGHMCGGIIINRYWIITAAHCFIPKFSENRLKPHNSVLKAGIQNLYTSVEHTQIKYIRRRRIHPNYKKDNNDFDIALIKLKTPLKLNDYVRPICLPIGQGNFASFTEIGSSGIITGWGSDQFSGHQSEELMQTTVAFKQCVHDEGSFPAMFCAGGGGVHSADACKGDSGGPLSVPIPGSRAGSNDVKWFLAGVISHGPKCKSNFGGDSVYTNVTTESILSWIIDQTSNPAK